MCTVTESDGEIHFDGTADGPEHEGTSLGFDGTPGSGSSGHGPADDPTGSGGTSGVSDGGADGSVDQTAGASGFDGTGDSPVLEPTEGRADAEDGTGSASYGSSDWQDEGADGPTS
jgi:hypothetical protein